MKTKQYPILSKPLVYRAVQKPGSKSHGRVSAWGLRGFLLVALCILPPALARAECQRWEVFGEWSVQQEDGVTYPLRLTYFSTEGSKAIFRGTAGVGFTSSVTGVKDGNYFQMQIRWGEKLGSYGGTIGPQGKIEGTMSMEVVAGQLKKLKWVSSRAMRCIEGTATSSSKSPSGPVPTGKAKVPASDPATPAEPSPPLDTKASSSPYIGATPKVVHIPGGGRDGSTTLTWDGGPAHPYAEVWVGLDGQDPTFVVERGKGSRRVLVEPGKTYRYILTDSGKDLATVTVTAR